MVFTDELRQDLKDNRAVKREKIHNQKMERYIEAKLAKEMAGPELIATTDGDYVNRFTGPE